MRHRSALPAHHLPLVPAAGCQSDRRRPGRKQFARCAGTHSRNRERWACHLSGAHDHDRLDRHSCELVDLHSPAAAVWLDQRHVDRGDGHRDVSGHSRLRDAQLGLRLQPQRRHAGWNHRGSGDGSSALAEEPTGAHAGPGSRTHQPAANQDQGPQPGTAGQRVTATGDSARRDHQTASGAATADQRGNEPGA